MPRRSRERRDCLAKAGLREIHMTRRCLPIFSLAAVIVACGASLPPKPEAAAALSRAIEKKLTRTVPASTYCMTANPDFSFADMGRVDLV